MREKPASIRAALTSKITWATGIPALASFKALVPQTDRINPSSLIATPAWAAAAWTALIGAVGVALAAKSRDLVGLVAGGLCLTPYAHQYDLAPLAPLAKSTGTHISPSQPDVPPMPPSPNVRWKNNPGASPPGLFVSAGQRGALRVQSAAGIAYIRIRRA